MLEEPSVTLVLRRVPRPTEESLHFPKVLQHLRRKDCTCGTSVEGRGQTLSLGGGKTHSRDSSDREILVSGHRWDPRILRGEDESRST